jgi:phosphopantothenoylcysteine decarboxylase/phosphopantothenate--cysteine ligase
VTGGIAAYKAAALARSLASHGRVRVVMTRAAQRFVTPLTFTALTGRPALTDIFDDGPAGPMAHIHEAEDLDLVVIAPATADFIARAAAGLADDLLSTMLLVTRAPLLLAPAMNVHMWEHPATQRNLGTLSSQAVVHLVGPEEGELACGTVGPGRMAEPERIVERALSLVRREAPLAGRRILITSGPTEEPIDPVRVVSNRSSGRMGRALAEAALERGARVVLVRGPVAVGDPAGAEVVVVRTTSEMQEAVEERLAESDALIMAAAVADYRPAHPSGSKLRKRDTGEVMTLELVRTEDILGRCAARRSGGRPLIVGFSLESDPERAVRTARDKLKRKGCDLMVSNVTSALGGDRTQVALVAPRTRAVQIGPAEKREAALRIIRWIEGHLDGPR